MKQFSYDMLDHIAPSTVILSTVWHKHLGIIHNIPDGIHNVFNMNSFDEISFDVYKEVDGKPCELWDKIVNNKYVYIPEHDTYYEIYVSVDDNTSTIKHITGKSSGETELSNRKLRNFHINDDIDINYTERYAISNGSVYEKNDQGVVDFAYDTDNTTLLPGQTEPYKATVFYRPIDTEEDSAYLQMKKRRSSLLHRVLADKCPDWEVGEVDDTLLNIQRTYTADNTSIYDFLTNVVGKEIECLFLFDTTHRKINVYDLDNKCLDCGYRGSFYDKCPKCESTNFRKGYGKDTGIFLSTGNFATQINLSANGDSIKNCLKMSAGDDLMTATVRNINPNGSDYIYHFSKAMYDDMPEELVDGLKSYSELCEKRQPEYKALTSELYQLQQDILYLKDSMMPETPIPGETTAAAQLSKLISAISSSAVSVQDLKSLSQSSADSAVVGYAKVLVDPRYTVELVGKTYLSDISGTARTWKGVFKVKALGTSDDAEDPDEATASDKTIVSVNGNYETFLKQKIEKSLDRTDASFQTLFKIKKDSKFKEELTKYSLNRLLSFKNTYDSVLEILVKMEVNESNKDFYGADLYNTLYLPYYNKAQLIQQEADVRDAQVKAKEEESDKVEAQRKAIRDELNFANYLGNDLFKVFCAYRKEGEYNNPNYISDGLETDQLIQRAQEFFDVASDEVKKASELELSISETLNNLLNLKEFRDYKDSFEIGDWLMTEVDEEPYRLRLVSVDYDEKSPNSISFQFSNIDRQHSISDSIQDILNKAQSIASSYNYVAHQAAQGDEANNDVTEMKETGVDSSTYNITAGANGKVQIDEHGIVLKDYDEINGEDYPEQLKIINNMIAFTKDNWETVEAAIGKIRFMLNNEEMESYGVNAQTLIAGIMIAGDIYSKNWEQHKSGNRIVSTGTHIDLNSGAFIIGGEGDSGNGIEYDPNSKVIRLGRNVVVSNGSGNGVSNYVPVEDYVEKQDKLTPRKSMTIVDEPVYDNDGRLLRTTHYLDAKPVEITQEQYDALTEEQKADGVIRYITDAPNNGHYYGTTVPVDTLGYDGDIYVYYGSGGIERVYAKILGKWLAIPMGGNGSYVRQKAVTENVTAHSTITVRGGVR